jgi:hypothetical protein
MTTPSEERLGHLQFSCHHELAKRARDLLLFAHQLDRVQVNNISVLGIHLSDDPVGIALRLPSLALEIQHLGVKDLGIPFPYYFQL